MSEPTDAVATLDRLLDEDPFAPGIDDAITVAGDLLQARGHARGELIVLEQALAQADHGTRSRHRSALLRWLSEHQTALLGQAFVAFGRKRGALRLEFRGGRLRGLFVDLRRIDHEGLTIPQVIASLLGSHGARRLVELRVRVRKPGDLAQVLAGFEQVHRKPPLEFVLVSMSTRPDGHFGQPSSASLRQGFPQLWFATQAGVLVPLYDEGLDVEAAAAELQAMVGAPMSRALRVHVGRGLTSAHESTTLAAAEVLAGLGESARVFVPCLRTLLQPNVSPQAATWLLPVLPSLGAWARELIPAVARIPGSGAIYHEPVRRLATRSLQAFASLDQPDKPSQARA